MCKESAHKSLSELLLSEASQQSRYHQLEHKNTLVNNDLRLRAIKVVKGQFTPKQKFVEHKHSKYFFMLLLSTPKKVYTHQGCKILE